jgi:hypothetical protein
MPAKNVYHSVVRDALVADGWTVTDDPLFLRVGERDLYIDLAAERAGGEVVAIELIAVEVQTFGGHSPVAALQQAIGQFGMYRTVLDDQQPERVLYLAVPFEVYDGILTEPLGERMVEQFGVKLLLFDPDRRRALRWIS